ncbi:hypothetical protein KIH23_02750 [Flavobacterium sp. CYK-55]|uniref:hypothetical protein n=1 Tax=Flavobacterium sp. CYK-55 TaxID=2835529 RepID=UPI001BCAC877|nr:hypothetical protein [Flavobacterium sp. CYK-55]MBS7786203.1 hypothetical protein [Flavobacterium sp. CYK-55]
MMKTKLTVGLLVLALSQGMQTNAQGLLGKLKDKVKSAEGSASKKDQTRADEDAAQNFLDQQSIKKDSYGFGGVYYCSQVIYGENEAGDKVPLKKFLFEFDEKKMELSAKSQYAYQSGNQKIRPLVWGRTSYPLDAVLRISNSFKQPALIERISSEHFYYTNYKPKDYNEHPYERGAAELVSFADADIMQLEPGILLVGNNRYMPLHNRGEQNKTEYDDVKIQNLMLFYTADKKEQAQTYTADDLHAFANQFAQLYAQGFKRFKNDLDKEWAAEMKRLYPNGIPRSGSSSKSSSGSIVVYLNNKSDRPVKLFRNGKYVTTLNPRSKRSESFSSGTLSTDSGWSAELNASMNKQEFVVAQ